MKQILECSKEFREMCLNDLYFRNHIFQYIEFVILPKVDKDFWDLPYLLDELGHKDLMGWIDE